MIYLKTRRFIARYFSFVVLIFYKIKFLLINFYKKNPVIIITPGKVGSSSVYYTLRRKLSYHLFHIHYLSEKGIKESKRLHLSSDRKSLPLHLIVSQLLRKKLTNYNGKINIITIVREPISREISAYFQNTEFYKNTVENKRLEVNVGNSIVILEKLFDQDITYILKKWFDQEIKSEFGIDIFSKPFNEKDGYNIYRYNKCNLLLLKMETMNKIFTVAIKEFLNLKDEIELQNSNIGVNKFYSNSYQKVKSDFRLPVDKINQITNSEYFQYFYSERTSSVKKKWQRNNY